MSQPASLLEEENCSIPSGGLFEGLKVGQNSQLFSSLRYSSFARIRAPFCGNLQREVICKEAAETCCLAEQVQAVLYSAAELPLR